MKKNDKLVITINRELGSGGRTVGTEAVFKIETVILEGIAEDESCVVAGRLGFYVFCNYPNYLNILNQASRPFRLKRVMRKQGQTEAEARKTIEKMDKMRENYVKTFNK